MNVEYAHIYQNGLKIFDENPPIDVIKDCLYIPRINYRMDDAQHGIYDFYGRLVDAGGSRRGWPNHTHGQSHNCCISPSFAYPWAPEECYFYGGHMHKHYGHFIIQVLPRYWARKGDYKKHKILVHSMESVGELFSIPWMREFFNILDVKEEDFVIFDRPTRIKNLIMPGASFEEEHFAHKIFAEFCNNIGLQEGEGDLGDKPVFLTRSRFTSTLRSIQDEYKVADILEADGFRVISPETLTLREQFNIFSQHRPTVGFVGSAFHNSIFCPSPIGVALSCDWTYCSNYYLSDQVNNASIAYLKAPAVKTLPMDGPRLLYKVEQPEVVADYIRQVVDDKIWERSKPPISTPAEDNFIQDKKYHIKTDHGTYLQINKQTGIIHHSNSVDPDTIRLIGQLSPTGWIRLTTPSGEILTMMQDQRQGPYLYYKMQYDPLNRLGLLHPLYKRYLCAIPNGTLDNNRSDIGDWESFSLEEL